jgi:hypothetical protein
MRHLKIGLPIFFFLATLAFSACNHDDNSGGSNNGGSTPTPGSWKITYFFDKQDETGHYSSYTFDFESNGSLTASNGSQSWNGTWTTGIDDSSDKMVFSFPVGAPSALQELQEDWLIIQITDNLMHLEHTSGGNGDTDVVKFEK